MYYVFIVNPSSGGARSYNIWRKIECKLQEKNINYKAYITTGAGDARNIVHSLTTDEEFCKNNTIIAVGGDGTVNEVVDGLCIDNEPVIGYIPTGTGNDLARGLEIDTKSDISLQNILDKRTIKKMDYGYVEFENKKNSRFVVSTGVGFDADIVSKYSKLKASNVISKGILKKLAYINIGIKEFIRNKTFSCTLINEHEKINCKYARFISIHNQKSEGGGFKFAPLSKNDDGKLSVCIVDTENLLLFAFAIINSLTGNFFKLNYVKNFDTPCIELILDKEQFLHIDGENYGKHSKIKVGCKNKKINIIV